MQSSLVFTARVRHSRISLTNTRRWHLASGCIATGWTQEPYSISAETISLYLDQHPLHPFNALGHFLIEQKLSILDIEKIQRLNCCTGLPHVYSEMKLPMKKQNKTPLTSFAASQRRNSTDQCHPCWRTFVILKLKKEQGAVFRMGCIE